MPPRSWPNNLATVRALPMAPLWLGFLADSALYSLLWWAAFVAGTAVLVRLRTPAGHCPRCRYDLAGNPQGGCPECGWGVAGSGRVNAYRSFPVPGPGFESGRRALTV